MKEQEQAFKRIKITVNGEPVGNEMFIDQETYVPVARQYVTNLESAQAELAETSVL
ncbi:hypothetical protein [Paenibacillus sp. YPG26]|uniref:hypothetical protein n=1 Tax=Paenibacillus sp. YPG26 TaxID=2878915 RepID=UPI0020407860|nr:hypothetical protein [Paenibacillus sp. YPG26]USB34013.1 hypothetical protein LDO05_04095 [Paenibacillus sp. YPG26]